MSDWNDMAREICTLSSKLDQVKMQLAEQVAELESVRSQLDTQRKLNAALTAAMYERVDADIAISNKMAKVLALASAWRKE